MLFFLRKVRKQLMKGNKLLPYLLYAVGEIVLVVAGILIAVQIEDSYQQSQTKQLEIKYLKEMHGNLTFDLQDIQFNIEFNESRKRSNEAVLHHLTNQLPYHDSLDYHLSNLLFSTRTLPNMGAYESLKSKGLEIISNDSLRANITYVYSFAYHNAIDFEHADDHPYQYDVLWPAVMDAVAFQAYEYNSTTNTAKPVNYASMLKNTQFQNALKSNTLIRTYMIQMYVELKADVENLIDQIDTELKLVEK
ncbi:MAG: hypothetical protein ACI8QD_002543 [Cyclobacteriaceae bacterium]|jgi:hypothetical protein